MKNSLSIFFISAAFLFSFGTLRAQDELDTFQHASGVLSVLFRGKEATRFNFPSNGNPYWEHAAFESGDIVFEDNLYRDVLLNIDAWGQQALVKNPSTPQVVALTPSLTSSLTIGGRSFVGIGPGDVLPEGFYEVFGTGPEQVYKRVDKELQNSVNNVNGEVIGYYDENYRSDVYRYFAIKTTYYFRDAEGEFSRFKSKGSLLRKFPSNRRKDIRKAVKAAGVPSSKAYFDDYCKAVLNAAAR
jgi:hypothetical protein